MHDDDATVLDIVIACRRIRRFLADASEREFVVDEQMHWAVISQLTVIGEAVKRLSLKFRDEHSQIAWSNIARLRDRVVHPYNKIDLHRIWAIVSADVPSLLAALEPMLPPDDATSQ